MRFVNSMVQFQDGGENVETVAMRKADFDKLMLERKAYRAALALLTISLIATAAFLWRVELQSRTLIVVPAPTQK